MGLELALQDPASPFGRAGQGHVLWILALSLGAEGDRRGGRLAWKAMGQLGVEGGWARGLAGDEAGWPIGAIGTEGDRGGWRAEIFMLPPSIFE